MYAARLRRNDGLQVFEYVTAKIGASEAPGDTQDAELAIRTALDSVFTSTSLVLFVTLSEEEKEERLVQLADLVLGNTLHLTTSNSTAANQRTSSGVQTATGEIKGELVAEKKRFSCSSAVMSC